MAVKGLNTAASFRGRLYVNVIVVPSTNADQFEKFCKLNKSCCPLLQRSAPGDTTTKPLVRDSDIRYGQMLFYSESNHSQPGFWKPCTGKSEEANVERKIGRN